jgi:hypothetical protein
VAWWIECVDGAVRAENVETPGHDCDYVRARNELIPQAMRIASQKIGDAVSKRAEWTRCFSDTLDELSRPLLNGLPMVRRSVGAVAKAVAKSLDKLAHET